MGYVEAQQRILGDKMVLDDRRARLPDNQYSTHAQNVVLRRVSELLLCSKTSRSSTGGVPDPPDKL
jgi:hypothetical protein